MCLAAVWIFLLGFFGFLDMPIIGVYFALWALNGLSQATVTPGTVDTIHNWFKETSMGCIMGTHSSSANFGNLTGTAIFAICLLGAGAPWPATT